MGKIFRTGRSGDRLGSAIRVTNDAGEVTGVVRRWGEVYFAKYAREKVIPMMGGTAEGVKSLFEKPRILVFVVRWVTDGQPDNHAFICRQICLAECISTILLLENMKVAHCLINK